MLSYHKVVAFRSILRPSFRLSSSGSGSTTVKKVPLNDFHSQHGAKMVPFAGFSMPVQYSDQSLIESHLHTRSQASLFDVSHMLQTKVYGKDRFKYIECLVPSDVSLLKPGCGTLSVFTNDQGGIKDDLIVTNTEHGYLYIVTNAGCIDKDIQHMQTQANIFKSEGFDVRVEHIDQSSSCLLALQGPQVFKLLNQHCSVDISKLYFMSSVLCSIHQIPDCRLSRCGYTGEDGFEILVDSKRAEELCRKFIHSKDVSLKLAGLGARDSLRLEAGLCLYGNDIDETTSPVDASLLWLIGKQRRQSASFPGADTILKQIKEKSVTRKRIGLIGDTGRPPRSGCAILDLNGNEVGKVTSGCPSPCLKKNIAMGYCDVNLTSIGTKLQVRISGSTLVPVTVAKMPFIATNYYHQPKN